MKAKISSKSDSIQVVYANYLDEKYIVNRRYQRKLVWTQEEKMAFIDSVYKQYSVPLILLAEREDGSYEIIDGMQRLNAVVSFIENEFGITYDNEVCYFDLDALASSKERKDLGEISQQEPKLPRQVCIEIANYLMPCTYISADENDVEEIFRRINSFGRQLSKQEIRQAGALGAFPDMVRRMSSKIRGDVTVSNLVNLSKMKYISLANKNLGYGIDLRDVFWTKQNIITIQNMRLSRDEEIVAFVLSYMITGKDTPATSKYLNQLYKHDLENESAIVAVQMEKRINELRGENIEKWFDQTHSTLLGILDYAQKKVEKNFRSLLFSDKEAEGLVRTYQVVFLALFELVVRDHMMVNDYEGLIKSLDGLGMTQLSGITKKETWNDKGRYRMIQGVKGVMRNHFKPCEGEDAAKENWALDLENILRLSKVENGSYDFKQGFRDFGTGKFNRELVSKCVKTLTAMVNKGPKTKGYVIVGITEGEESLKAFQKVYNTQEGVNFENTEFYITGIDNEVKKYHHGSIDEFVKEVMAIIQKEPIDTYSKQYILTNIKTPSYYNQSVMMLSLQSETSPITYNDHYYVRNGSNNTKAERVSDITAIQGRFK